jgi:hypothetical protein
MFYKIEEVLACISWQGYFAVRDPSSDARSSDAPRCVAASTLGEVL